MKSTIFVLFFFSFFLNGMAQRANIIIPTAHDGKVERIIFDEQGKYFYTIDEWKIIMWDFKTNKQLFTFPITNKNTTQSYGSTVHNLRDFVISADGNTLAFTTPEDELIIYSTVTGRKLRTVQGVHSSINFSRDGKTIYDLVRGPEGGDIAPGTNGRMIRAINVQTGAISDYWHKKDMDIWGTFIRYFYPVGAGKVINFDEQGYTVLDLDEKREIIRANVNEQLREKYQYVEEFNRNNISVKGTSGLFSFQKHRVKEGLGYVVWDIFKNKEFAFISNDRNVQMQSSFVENRFLYATKSSRFDRQDAFIIERDNKIAKQVNITGSDEIKVAALSKKGNTVIYCGVDDKLYRYDLDKKEKERLSPLMVANINLQSVFKNGQNLLFNSISERYDKNEAMNFESESVNFIVDMERLATQTVDTIPVKQAKELSTVRINRDSFLLAYNNPKDEFFIYSKKTQKSTPFLHKGLTSGMNSPLKSFPKIPTVFPANNSAEVFLIVEATEQNKYGSQLVKYNLVTKQSTKIFFSKYFEGNDWEDRRYDDNNGARLENALVMDKANGILAAAEFRYKGSVRVMDLHSGKILGQHAFSYDSIAYTGELQTKPYYITQVRKINAATARVLGIEKIFEINLNGGTGKEIPIATPEYFIGKRNLQLYANNRMETVVSTYQNENGVVAEIIYGLNKFKLSHLLSPISKIEFSDNDSVLYTINENKTINAYNALTGEFYGILYIFENSGDWVFMGADGRFDGTKDGMQNLYYLKDREPISIDKVFEKYYTPNLFIRLVKGEKFEPIPEIDLKPKPIAKISYDEIKRNLEVEDEIPFYTNTSGIAEITVTATAPEDNVDEIRLFHNGKVLNLATRGLFVTDADGSDTKKYSVQLMPGNNNFQAIALNSQRTESEPDEIFVTYNSGNIPATPIVKKDENKVTIDPVDKNATMHLIVVGINAYKGKINPLTYALPDATAFKEEVEKDAKTVLGTVKTYFVSDTTASKSGIAGVFNMVKNTAKPQDVFIFYYAGHGYIHPDNKEFYLVSADVEDGKESLLKNGLSSKELQQYAVDIPAQKQVFILDACQSAGAFEQMLKHDGEQQKVLAVVSRSTGTHWMAASGSTETAKEFSALGHGAFTYTLLQALKGQAANNKMITINGLKSFLAIQVPELIKKYGGGSQYPASYGFGNDFPVEILK